MIEVARRDAWFPPERRRQIGDDGSDYPLIEAVVQEFWNYGAGARAKAETMSHNYRRMKEAETAAATRNEKDARKRH